MKKKVFIFVAAILVMSLMLAGCGTSGEASKETSNTSSQAASEDVSKESVKPTEPAKKPVKVMFVSVVSGGVAWGAAERGFLDACEELGWDGQYVAPTAPNDTAQMVELYEKALTNNCDFLIGVVGRKEAAEDVLTRAKEKGMVVITTNTRVGEELSNAWIGTDPVSMGKAQATAVLKEAEKDKFENITLVYMQTKLAVPTQDEQFKVMSEEIKKVYPNAVLMQDACDSNAQTASDKLGAYIQGYPNLNVVVCQDGYGAPGIANYIEGAKLQDKIVAIGIDDSPEILEFVENGALRCTIAQNFYAMGYEGVKLGEKVLNGGEIDYNNDSGTIVIYKDGVAAHIELLKKRGLAK